MEHVWHEATASSATACANSDVAVGGSPPVEPSSQAVVSVLGDLARDPSRYLLSRWNWKSALMSSLRRATIFFFTNLTAGWHAAVGAMVAELALRSVTSGFYGGITEALASAHPAWQAIAAAMILLPCLAHSLEFIVHWLRHTPELKLSIASSVAFTAISTAFNLYAMRRGTLIVGHGSRPLREDLNRVPGLILEFLIAGPRMIIRKLFPTKRIRR